VTSTEDCRVKVCSHEMVTCVFMHPEAQTTTRGILAVSTGALEILLQYIWRFRSGHPLNTTVHDPHKRKNKVTLKYIYNIYCMFFDVIHYFLC